jgi:ABC-type Fe3+-hydroxamate transport system substrate-binding protein
MAAVPAVAEERILVLPAAAMSSGSGGIDGLEAIAHWLHPELVPAP